MKYIHNNNDYKWEGKSAGKIRFYYKRMSKKSWWALIRVIGCKDDMLSVLRDHSSSQDHIVKILGRGGGRDEEERVCSR